MSVTTVLVIEDDRACRRMIEGHLKRAGYHVLQADTGSAGIDLARAGGVDLITLDIRMHPIDGWAVFEALRAEGTTRDIPIVFVTIVDHEIVGRDLVTDGYLTKPFRGQQLLEVVERTLLRSANRPREAAPAEGRAGSDWPRPPLESAGPPRD